MADQMRLYSKRCNPATGQQFVPSSLSPTPERRSLRLEDRRRTSLGPFQSLPSEIIQHIISFLPVRSLSQLVQVSSGWHWFLLGWLQLQSSAWIIAPARRFVYPSNDFYDEYSELGLLCRRVFRGSSMSERVQIFWTIIYRVERASINHDLKKYEPTFVGASNFFKAAVALNSCRSAHERFEVVWQVLRDVTDADPGVLDLPPGLKPSGEMDLRLALRVIFLCPSARARNVRLKRLDRGSTLRAVLCKLTAPQQARLLFIVYGPREGSLIDWERPCHSTFSSLTQMIHVVSEMAGSVSALARCSSPAYIFSLIKHLTVTPKPWLPRYEVMLLLLVGPQAAASYLSGFLTNNSSMDMVKGSMHVAHRIAQMLSLSELCKLKIVSGGFIMSGPVYLIFVQTASVNILQVLIHFFRLVPATMWPVNIIRLIVSEAISIGNNVGGQKFEDRIRVTLNQILDYYCVVEVNL